MFIELGVILMAYYVGKAVQSNEQEQERRQFERQQFNNQRRNR